mmetsp:Transcript_11106/g.32535  ORF Transcript_11106/g.32535 Transcript_11106/m.32535 type:complete len:266 (+) Transcript_11106:1084-1881(+)
MPWHGRPQRGAADAGPAGRPGRPHAGHDGSRLRGCGHAGRRRHGDRHTGLRAAGHGPRGHGHAAAGRQCSRQPAPGLRGPDPRGLQGAQPLQARFCRRAAREVPRPGAGPVPHDLQEVLGEAARPRGSRRPRVDEHRRGAARAAPRGPRERRGAARLRSQGRGRRAAGQLGGGEAEAAPAAAGAPLRAHRPLPPAGRAARQGPAGRRGRALEAAAGALRRRAAAGPGRRQGRRPARLPAPCALRGLRRSGSQGPQAVRRRRGAPH